MVSKLNKKELYEQFKKITKENLRLQLFLNNSEDVRNKQKIVIECQEEEIKQLKSIINECRDFVDINKDSKGLIDNYELRQIESRLDGFVE